MRSVVLYMWQLWLVSVAVAGTFSHPCMASRVHSGMALKESQIGGLQDEHTFSVTVCASEGSPLRGAKIVLFDTEKRKIGTYRTRNSGEPMELSTEGNHSAWISVSKRGYASQFFQVDLSLAGWGTTVFLGKKEDAYYETLDPAYPSGRKYPYTPIEGVVLLHGKGSLPVSSGQVDTQSTELIWSFLPPSARHKDLEGVTITAFNQQGFLTTRKAQLGACRTENWSLLRQHATDIRICPLIQIGPYDLAAFSNMVQGRVMPGKPLQEIERMIAGAGFRLLDKVDSETGRFALQGDPSWGFEMVEKVKVLIHSGLFLEVYPDILYVTCVNPPDGC